LVTAWKRDAGNLEAAIADGSSRRPAEVDTLRQQRPGAQ
jgi:hypothetical protein